MKLELITNYHNKNFTLGLALTERLRGSRERSLVTNQTQSTIRDSFKELVYKTHMNKTTSTATVGLSTRKAPACAENETFTKSCLPPSTNSAVSANFGIQRIFKKLPLLNY